MKRASITPCDRPQRGVLCMAISNYILRSRNNYDFDNVFKCVNKETTDASFYNGELWMRRKSCLNDKREGRVMKEVFANRTWIKYDWAKNMKFTYERESFTCSFSKKSPTKKLKEEYGEYVYGYHNDTIGPSISTLIKCGKTAKFSQFIMYDIIYSREDFKKEMNYLFSIIDTFSITDEKKRFFLEEIIDYWKLTIKDKRWAYEQERRYEIMHFKEYDYVECSIDDVFLKNKTPLLLYPDFIIGENHMKPFLLQNAKEKAKFQSFDDAPMICCNCLFRSPSFNKKNGCPVCGSKIIITIS